MKLRIHFDNTQTLFKVTYSLKMLIRLAILKTLELEGYDFPSEISVLFTDNEEIAKINAEHRGMAKATDVLSFPMDADGFALNKNKKYKCSEDMPLMLGDIVLSLEKVVEQADEFGHGYDREVAYLTAHSVLHLLGYDHETSEDEDKIMREKQRQVMTMLRLDI